MVGFQQVGEGLRDSALSGKYTSRHDKFASLFGDKMCLELCLKTQVQLSSSSVTLSSCKNLPSNVYMFCDPLIDPNLHNNYVKFILVKTIICLVSSIESIILGSTT